MALLIFLELYSKVYSVIPVSLGFIVVGIFADLNNKWKSRIHYIGALTIILGGLGIVIELNYIWGLIITGVLVLFTLLSFRKKLPNKIWWIEVLALFSIIGFLIRRKGNYGKDNV